VSNQIVDEVQRKCKSQIPSMLGRAWPVFLVFCQAVPQRSQLSKILGETIRTERTKAGLSQEQLAEKAGLARNYVGNVERAEYKVTVETLALIAKALNLRVRDLTRDL
jgi:ribosome-binding protein aMBF1 (putative translation factor)